MMFKKHFSKIIIAIFLATLVFQAAAQETKTEEPKEERAKWKERFFTGGNLSLTFGSYTYIEVSPILGYRISNAFSTGIGATYIYLRDKSFYQYNNSFTNKKSNIYGGRAFLRYQYAGKITYLRPLFVYTEYEHLIENYKDYSSGIPVKKSLDYDNLWLGGGYYQKMGRRSGAYIMIIYDVLEDKNIHRDNPVFRAGFEIGL